MTIFNILLLIPYSFNLEYNLFLQTESNAVEKSINAQHVIRLLVELRFSNIFRVKQASTVLAVGRNPN